MSRVAQLPPKVMASQVSTEIHARCKVNKHVRDSKKVRFNTAELVCQGLSQAVQRENVDVALEVSSVLTPKNRALKFGLCLSGCWIARVSANGPAVVAQHPQSYSVCALKPCVCRAQCGKRKWFWLCGRCLCLCFPRIGAPSSALIVCNSNVNG